MQARGDGVYRGALAEAEQLPCTVVLAGGAEGECRSQAEDEAGTETVGEGCRGGEGAEVIIESFDAVGMWLTVHGSPIGAGLVWIIRVRGATRAATLYKKIKYKA